MISVALYFVCNRLDLMRCHPCLCCFENTCKIWPLLYLVLSSLNYLADNYNVILGHRCYTYMQLVFAEILKRDYKGKSFLKNYIRFCLKRLLIFFDLVLFSCVLFTCTVYRFLSIENIFYELRNMTFAYK